MAPTLAHAEPSDADRTLAAALFREGKALMDKNDFAPACAKLEESQRLDPGGGTLLNVALCHEKQGRAATAWGEFIEALGIARRDHRQARVELAEEHIAKLEPTLSKMTIVVPPEADEPTLDVTRDGASVGRAAWGMAFPVDPGEHRVQAAASGKLPFRSTVTVSPGEARGITVQIPSLERDPDAKLGTATAAPAAAPSPVAPAETAPGPAGHAVSGPLVAAPVTQDRGGASAQGVWGWGTVALGGAGVITGTVLSVVALGKKGDSKDRCPRDPCDAQAVELSRDAGRLADFATVSFGVGLTALAVGAVLLLTDGPSPSKTAQAPRRAAWELYPDLRGSSGSVTLRGRF